MGSLKRSLTERHPSRIVSSNFTSERANKERFTSRIVVPKNSIVRINNPARSGIHVAVVMLVIVNVRDTASSSMGFPFHRFLSGLL